MSATYSPNGSDLRRSPWTATVLATLACWLGGLLLLDLVVMPSLYVSGMMSSADFAIAGSLIFGIFNRAELLCAGLTIAGVLAIARQLPDASAFMRPALLLAFALLAAVVADTYALAPEMVGLGGVLNWGDPAAIEVPAAMTQLHGSYFSLEALKLVAGGALLALVYRHRS